MYLIENKEFLRSLDQLKLQAQRILRGTLAENRLINKRGRSFEFIDYRNYVCGDDFRNIDWNIYRRLGEIMVRLFHAREDTTIHILTDCSKSMDFGTPSKKVQAVKTVLGFAYIALANNEKVRIYCCSNGNLNTDGRIYSRKNDILLIDKYIEDIRAESYAGWESALTGFIKNTRKPGLLILISDFLEDIEWEQIINRFYHSGHDLIAVQILNRDELEPGITGDYLFIDSENNTSVDLTVDTYYLSLYKQRLTQFLDTLKNIAGRCNFGYTLCPADKDFINVILNSLNQRVTLR